jgi:hypothetical protein
LVRIAISLEAFEAIARTIPLGSVGYEAEASERGQRLIRLEDAMAARRDARAGSFSDAIIRIAGRRRLPLDAGKTKLRLGAG